MSALAGRGKEFENLQGGTEMEMRRRRVFHIVCSVLFLSLMAMAQLPQCTVTGTLHNVDGSVNANGSVTIIKVIKAGALISMTPSAKFRANASGVVTFTVPRASTAYIYAESYGLNVTGGVALPIPDAATAVLNDLVPIAQVPTNGSTVKDEGTALASPVGTFNFAGAGVTATQSSPGVALITIPGASGGTWGSITGTLSNQTDLQSALNAKQNSLGFTAVPNTRQVAGHALNADVTVSKSDVGLGNVPNLDATAPANIVQDSTHRFATDAEKSTWNGKQDPLGFTPENVANRRTTFQVTPDDSHYPSEKLVKDSLDGKQAAGTYVNTFNGRSGAVTPATNDYSFSQLSGKPTTLSGYGITDSPVGANPSGSIGLSALNGSATTFMRSDAAPAIDQSIAPTWTGAHIHSLSNAAAWAIGPNGNTNPVIRIITNTASQPDGVSITGGAAGAGAMFTALSSGSNAGFTFTPKGTGNLLLSSGLFQIGGTSSSFAAIRRNSTFIESRLADDSNYGGLAGSAINLWNASPSLKAQFNSSTGFILASDLSLIFWNGTSLVSGAAGGNISAISNGVLGVGTGAQGSFAGRLKLTSAIHAGTTIAALNASPTTGEVATVTDGDASLVWGATVVNSGSGATKYLVWYNGSNWTVVGK